jgi:ABC-type glutathione transport system ATPase component
VNDTTLLEVENLSVRFGPVTAVSSVSFKVDRGEVFGIVGESGAGKSAAARGIIGLLPALATRGGAVRFKGEDLLHASPGRIRQIRGGEHLVRHSRTL